MIKSFSSRRRKSKEIETNVLWSFSCSSKSQGLIDFSSEWTWAKTKTKKYKKFNDVLIEFVVFRHSTHATSVKLQLNSRGLQMKCTFNDAQCGFVWLAWNRSSRTRRVCQTIKNLKKIACCCRCHFDAFRRAPVELVHFLIKWIRRFRNGKILLKFYCNFMPFHLTM